MIDFENRPEPLTMYTPFDPMDLHKRDVTILVSKDEVTGHTVIGAYDPKEDKIYIISEVGSE